MLYQLCHSVALGALYMMHAPVLGARQDSAVLHFLPAVVQPNGNHLCAHIIKPLLDHSAPGWMVWYCTSPPAVVQPNGNHLCAHIIRLF
jgi:hypothetical protein